MEKGECAGCREGERGDACRDYVEKGGGQEGGDGKQLTHVHKPKLCFLLLNQALPWNLRALAQARPCFDLDGITKGDLHTPHTQRKQKTIPMASSLQDHPRAAVPAPFPLQPYPTLHAPRQRLPRNAVCAGAPPLLSEPFSCEALVPGEDTHLLLPVYAAAAPAAVGAAAFPAEGGRQPAPAAVSVQAPGGNRPAPTAAPPDPAYPVSTPEGPAGGQDKYGAAQRLLQAACRGHGDALPVGAGRLGGGPFLMPAARLLDAPMPSAPPGHSGSGAGSGAQECVCVVVTVRLVARGPPGCWALVVSCLGGLPPHLLHNATPMALRYHEASTRCAWAGGEGDEGGREGGRDVCTACACTVAQQKHVRAHAGA